EEGDYRISDSGKQDLVGGQVGELKVKHAALLRTGQIARPAQFQVYFGNFEPIIGAYHGLQPEFAVLTDFAARHQDAVRLLGTTPHAPPQLVELRQTESLGILNDHYRRVGHVYPYFNHSCGYHN